jgi:pyruvate dehydrogenase E2 component (dihydrolipoamide acetyltransferase)
VLFTVEGDKALNEVESFETGILRLPPDSPPPGSTVKVGALLAYIVQPGERAPFENQKQTAVSPPKTVPSAVTDSVVTPASNQSKKARYAISPRALRIAAELGVDVAALKGSGRTGRIVERDVRANWRAAVEQRPVRVEVRASPLARRAAQELGVDLEQLAASKPGQRIERADVEAAAQSPAPVTVTEKAQPITQVRRVIAERMATSAHTTASVTLTTEVDATELVRLRGQLKNDSPSATQPIPTYTDLMSKLTAHALLEHPALNARIEGDAIVQSTVVHIGLAVDTERGLLVPVLRDAQSKGLRQITHEAAAIIERARAGRLGADELRGSTFTITNLGMYEIDAFTPIINLPECAILGLGRILPKQVVVDEGMERVAIRQMMALSLTFDHRLVDGAPAARFLQRVKQLVEQPYLWLVS